MVDEKFPEEIDPSYKPTHPLWEPEYFEIEAVKKWIELCVRDSPMSWGADHGNYGTGEYWIYWFDRWFPQFGVIFEDGDEE